MGNNKFNKKKNNFYSKEDNDDESEDAEILFIGTSNSDEESEVDIESKYMVVVNEIEKCSKIGNFFERETIKVPRINKSNNCGLEELASRGQEE